MANSNLPVIRQSGNLTEYVPVVQSPSRLQVLEERLNQQERTTQALIERAFKIKEDVLNSLNFSRGTWQEEKHSRELLAEHIRNITAVVNRLNTDIGILEEHLRVQGSSSSTTTTAVKNLEVHHVASLTDLRGRVVRCDNAISKLASDLRSCFETVKSVDHQQQDIYTKLNDRFHALEAQILQMSHLVDRTSSSNKLQLQQVEGDTSQQITRLDTKTKSLVNDLKNSVTSYHTTEASEREKLESRMLSFIEKALQPRDARVERIEKRLDDLQLVMDTRLKKLSDTTSKLSVTWEAAHKTLEEKIVQRLDAELRKQTEDVQRLKQEYREGFSTVHESITNMKTVVDGKRKLLEDQLRKEISHIRKMIVLV